MSVASTSTVSLTGVTAGGVSMTGSAAYVVLISVGVGLGVVLMVASFLPTDDDAADPRATGGVSGAFGASRRSCARARPVRDAAWWRRVAVTVAAAAMAGWSTGWPVAAVLAAAAVWWLPTMLGPDRAHQLGVAKIEAVAGWAEQLRDTLAAASGLEQAIITTARTAPAAIRPAVADLAARVHAGERLPVALAHAARAVADPTADLVVAALTMAAQQQSRQLAELLAALAAAAREEAAGRMRTSVARAQVRTSVRVIVAATAGLAAVLVVFDGGYLAPYNGVEGQLILVLVGALFCLAFAWLARISRPRRPARLLPDPDNDPAPRPSTGPRMPADGKARRR